MHGETGQIKNKIKTALLKPNSRLRHFSDLILYASSLHIWTSAACIYQQVDVTKFVFFDIHLRFGESWSACMYLCNYMTLKSDSC